MVMAGLRCRYLVFTVPALELPLAGPFVPVVPDPVELIVPPLVVTIRANSVGLSTPSRSVSS